MKRAFDNTRVATDGGAIRKDVIKVLIELGYQWSRDKPPISIKNVFIYIYGTGLMTSGACKTHFDAHDNRQVYAESIMEYNTKSTPYKKAAKKSRPKRSLMVTTENISPSMDCKHVEFKIRGSLSKVLGKIVYTADAYYILSNNSNINGGHGTIASIHGYKYGYNIWNPYLNEKTINPRIVDLCIPDGLGDGIIPQITKPVTEYITEFTRSMVGREVMLEQIDSVGNCMKSCIGILFFREATEKTMSSSGQGYHIANSTPGFNGGWDRRFAEEASDGKYHASSRVGTADGKTSFGPRKRISFTQIPKGTYEVNIHKTKLEHTEVKGKTFNTTKVNPRTITKALQGSPTIIKVNSLIINSKLESHEQTTKVR